MQHWRLVGLQEIGEVIPMVQRTIIQYVDDLNGVTGEDVASHTFSLDGIVYEIDLGVDSYERLLEGLGPFIGVARKNRRPSAPRMREGGRKGTGPDAALVREWANSQGIEVNSRGRVPQHVMDQYTQARGRSGN
ncbi:histone-like nucleoid-structuring protein Lsr2 [Streptomyces chartreusis]|uniref:histone-like nucleoid-structuring protein Lsr2 n=1 Tax=Streptomyces chartreusis TaxID=1969 RepID=UPI00368298CC